MEAAKHTGTSRWLSLRGLDAAKAGLTLYIVGLMTSGIYYARFHVLALDFTRIQSAVVGVYVILLYVAAPVAAVWCAAQLSIRKGFRLTVSIILLAALNAALARLLGYSWKRVAVVTLVTLALQLILFVDRKTLLASLRGRRLEIQLLHQPSRERLVVLGLVVCIHFSLFWFPRIPGNFAGGMPVHVQVFTQTAGLPDSRFAATKNKPQINSQMDSYALWLLYQTDTDVYLLDSLPADGTLIDDDVMRITQDQVIRMDYNTAP
ncbi:MAG TPA: hypothetical protein VGG56_05030 [Terracidiphilus sp.]|jgi:hypothetical protein